MQGFVDKDGGQPLMIDGLYWKTNFKRIGPFDGKQSLMEDNL